MNEVAAVSILLSIVTFFILIRGWASRHIDLFGFHTIFMYGMVHFFYIALAIMPWLGYPRGIYNPQGWGWTAMALVLPGFMALYLYFNKVSQKWDWPERLMPKMNYPVTTNGLVAMLAFIVVLTIGAYLSINASSGDYSELLILQFRPGLAAIMTGTATAVLLSNPRNPLLWIVFVSLAIFGLIISTVQGADRRFPLSTIMAIAFVAYYLRGRYWPIARLFTVCGAVLAGALVFTLMYSSVRHQNALGEATIGRKTEQLMDLVSNYRSDLIQENLEQLFFQDAPLVSCYLIENYPTNFPLIPFNGPYTFLVMPVPRSIWPDKPEGLGVVVQAQLRVPANLAPGIIGQGWAEMWVIGVAYYAIFFGMFTGVFDRLLRNRASNPYFVIAVGSSLGNIFGLPRGGTFMFLSQWATIAFMAWIFMWIGHAFLKSFMLSGKPVQFGPHEGVENPYAFLDAPSGDAAYDGQAAEDPTGLIDPSAAYAYAHPEGADPEPGSAPSAAPTS